jgi:hypothetical protein
MTTPQLTDPAPAPPPDKPQRKLYNQWGQYLLPDPDTGKERAWVRATTLAKALEDTYNLEIWSNRMVAKGMALRPDLVAMAVTLDVSADRDKLNRLAKDAKEAAGGSSGANMGTALHAMTEKVDAGEDLGPTAWGPFAGELTAYQRTMAQEGIVVLPQFSERIICVPELGVAGRLDKLAEYVGQPGLPYQVMDLKSQRSMDFGQVSIAVQLSLYAHAYAMWNPATKSWEDPPPIDQIRATVIWLPVGQDQCLLFDVDLIRGWEWAQLCAEVRRIRKCKPVTMRGSMRPALSPVDSLALEAAQDATATARQRLESPNKVMEWANEKYPALMKAAREEDAKEALERPRPTMYGDAGAWALVFKDAKTVEELTQAGRDATVDLGGQLPPELKALGRELRAKFLDTKAS